MISERVQNLGLKKSLKIVFSIELLVLLVWIPCVIFIFKFIQDRKIAGLVAGAGFMLIPIFNIFREKYSKFSRTSRMSRVIASSLFLLLSAMPIFFYRILNWDKNLEEISIFGLLTGRQLHSMSNVLFLMMLLVYLVSNLLDSGIIYSKKTKNTR